VCQRTFDQKGGNGQKTVRQGNSENGILKCDVARSLPSRAHLGLDVVNVRSDRPRNTIESAEEDNSTIWHRRVMIQE